MVGVAKLLALLESLPVTAVLAGPQHAEQQCRDRLRQPFASDSPWKCANLETTLSIGCFLSLHCQQFGLLARPDASRLLLVLPRAAPPSGRRRYTLPQTYGEILSQTAFSTTTITFSSRRLMIRLPQSTIRVGGGNPRQPVPIAHCATPRGW